MSELKWRGPEVAARIRKASTAGLEAAAIVVEAEAKGLIVSQNIIDTGNLLNSVTHEVNGQTARVGTPVEYGVYQEYGTKFMPARPWLRPAADEHRDEIREAYANQIREVL